MSDAAGAFVLVGPAMVFFHRYWELEDEQQKMLQQTQSSGT